MTENITQPTGIDVGDFIAKLGDDKLSDSHWLIERMRDATGENPKMWGPSIIGFGRYRYQYDSGRKGEFAIIGFSPRKRELAIYIVPGFEPFQAQLARLGKHKTGQSCLYIKRLSDINRDVLTELITASVTLMRNKYPT